MTCKELHQILLEEINFFKDKRAKEGPEHIFKPFHEI
jgi:hypothetical protein